MARNLPVASQAAIDGFLTQYPASTQGVYEQSLREAEQFIEKPLISISHDEIVRYQQHINHQASSTVSRKIATLSSFFKYLQITGKRRDNPTLGLRRPKIDPMRSIKWLEDSERERVLGDASGDPRTFALAWVALHGLRLAEIIDLDVDQYAEGVLWNVKGKGNKVRTIPLAADARNAIETYIGNRKSGPLFLSVRRKRIPRRTVQEMIYQLTERTGKRVSIHALRHTYGTRATRRGVNSITLARLMGHASTLTTQRYSHLNTADLQEANDMVYPAVGKAPITVIEGGRAAHRVGEV